MPVRVVLIDDHEMVIEGLKAMLTPFAESGSRWSVRRSARTTPWR